MKVGPRSDTVVFGIPCSFHISLMKITANSSALVDSRQGMKCACLEKRSITVRILSYSFDIGNFTMKSYAISSHGPLGIGKDFNRVGCLCPLLHWQVSQESMYLFTCAFIPGQ